MPAMTRGSATRMHVSCERGLSLVELMVGIAVGLFVVAAAAMLVSLQLGENRRVMLETQLQQDLRAAADLITREIRRAGYWDNAHNVVWPPIAMPVKNPAGEVTITGGATPTVEFEYRRAGQSSEFGFRLRGGVIQARRGEVWQELTDGNVMTVTEFNPTIRSEQITLACRNECTGGGTACWPTSTVREVVLDIRGRAAHDASVERGIRTVVRLRNDLIQLQVPNSVAPTQACPD